jgi:hypothetical protein
MPGVGTLNKRGTQSIMKNIRQTFEVIRETGMRPGSRAGLALLALSICGSAAAQQADLKVHPALQDRWSFQLGAFAPTVSTDASLNGSGGKVGTSVSFEDELNLADRKTLPTFLASARLGERWKIEFEYFTLHRSGTRNISKSINWGDISFPVNASVSSEFNSDIYRLSAGYSFVKNDREEMGVALGLHVTDFTTSLGAAAFGTKSGDTLAPLPTIGAYGAYAFTPQWLLSGRVDYFSLKYNDYDGRLLNATAGLDYRFHRNFGVGLGYRYIDYDVSVTKSSYNGDVKYRFSGPVIYGVASF